jgi:hypothetical protein
MRTAPRDGSHFLAWEEVIADERDEDGRVIKRDLRECRAVVAYFCFGTFVTYPFTGGIVTNRRFTAWQLLPDGPDMGISP